eukprot:TRINITY_DN21986_c0_g1_i1.p1 TRINITY_DN21986_c0_g1~~TRINITY_DN21986_c0_g1_i1.p1  ORF type:complete len:149 (+),score=50.41 TRINITY_DN21986_c0_g1_i1:116-562(+)
MCIRDRKQSAPTNAEDQGLKDALAQLQAQVGSRKRYASDLDLLLLSCAGAARAAHPDGLFEPDAQEMLYRVMPFSSLKAISANVKRLERETEITDLHLSIETELPILREAIAQSVLRASEAAAAKKPTPPIDISSVCLLYTSPSPRDS